MFPRGQKERLGPAPLFLTLNRKSMDFSQRKKLLRGPCVAGADICGHVAREQPAVSLRRKNTGNQYSSTPFQLCKLEKCVCLSKLQFLHL